MLIRFNALAITATLLVGHPAVASADMRNPDTSRLSVRLVNHAGVSNAVLSVARDETSRIFLAAGVIVNWPEPTRSGVAATHIHLGVMLIPDAPDGGSRRRNVLGRAVLTPAGSGHIVYAFYGAIERQARATQTEAAVVLGHVMAY